MKIFNKFLLTFNPSSKWVRGFGFNISESAFTCLLHPINRDALRFWQMQIQLSAYLLLDQAVANWAFLALVRGPVLEIVQLTFVTLIAHEPLATAAGAIVVTLHGNRAHWVTVTGWERTEQMEGQGHLWLSERVRGRRAEKDWVRIPYLCNPAMKTQRNPSGRSHTVSPLPLHGIHTALWLDDTPGMTSQSDCTGIYQRERTE